MRRVIALAGLAVAAVVALAGCTADPPARVPTARSGAPSTTATPVGPGAQEMQFVNCMRGNGIADMPDPIPGDTSGRSAVRYALDVLGKGSDDAFQAALSKCQNLLPAVDATKPADSAQQQRNLDFARCMRDHGLTDFPDDIQDNSAIWFSDSPKDPRPMQVADGTVVVNLANPTAKAAYDACQAAWLKSSS